MRYLATALVVFVAAAAQAQETVDLRPQWEAGQSARYHFKTKRTQDLTMSAGGESETFTSAVDSEGEVTWRIDDARPDGSFRATMTLDWMTADLTGPGGTQRNDSRKGSGETPPIHNLLNAMEGVPLTVHVAADGRVTKVEGVNAMRRKAQHPELVPEELDFVESATDLATLPGAPSEAGVGRSWTQRFRWTHELGHIEQDMRYELAGLEMIEGVPVATVQTTAKSELDFDRSQVPQDAPPMDVRLRDSDHQGHVIFDLVRNEAIGRQSTDRREIDVTIRLPGQTITRRTVETVESSTLRVAEK